MGMTITEKILARASGSPKVSPGDVAVVDVETACLIDLSFLPEGWRRVLKVADPSKVVIVFDHLVPAPTAQAAECMQTGRAFAKEFGIERLHDVGPDQGISHAVIADRAYALPGTVLVNADSHTCSAGAFNCAARGVGGPDMLYAVTTGKAWFRVGETIRYDLTGRLRPGVSAKDIFLTIAGKWGAHVNQNIEYGGPGMASMSLNARRTLTTMGTELSAEFVIFEPDDTLIDYVKARNPKPFTPTMPDADAVYKERRTIDLGADRAAGGIARRGGEQLGRHQRGRRQEDRPGVHRRLLQRHARRSGGGRAGGEGPQGRARHALHRDAEYRGDPSRRDGGRLCRDADGSRRDRHAGDLRRLCRRPYGRAGAERGVHHREHAQLQGPHGRCVGAYLHGLACHRRRIGARRDRSPARPSSSRETCHEKRARVEIRRQHQHRPDAAGAVSVSQTPRIRRARCS